LYQQLSTFTTPFNYGGGSGGTTGGGVTMGIFILLADGTDVVLLLGGDTIGGGLTIGITIELTEIDGDELVSPNVGT